MEQEEYTKEEIDWSYIEFVDNQDVLDLIEKASSFSFTLYYAFVWFIILVSVHFFNEQQYHFAFCTVALNFLSTATILFKPVILIILLSFLEQDLLLMIIFCSYRNLVESLLFLMKLGTKISFSLFC